MKHYSAFAHTARVGFHLHVLANTLTGDSGFEPEISRSRAERLTIGPVPIEDYVTPGPGFEPGSQDSKSWVLPLDEPGKKIVC